jgi:hypothetical protein
MIDLENEGNNNPISKQEIVAHVNRAIELLKANKVEVSIEFLQRLADMIEY